MTTLRRSPALLFAPVLLLAACAGPPPAAPLVLANAVLLSLPGGVQLEYDRGRTGQKPYVRHLRTAAGRDLLRDAPPDHEHHHGLMLALGVDDLDFWGERYAEHPGVQRERELVPVTTTGADGQPWRGFVERIDWLDPRDDRCLLHEERQLLVPTGGTAGAALVGLRSTLVPAGAGVQLWGRHYFGLGLRLAAVADAATTFVHSDGPPGRVVRGDERLTAGRWCAGVLALPDGAVTVALFAHPRNARATGPFFTMAQPFAYLAATLDLEHAPLPVPAATPLRLAFALALFDHAATAAEIETTWRHWVDAFAVDPAR